MAMLCRKSDDAFGVDLEAHVLSVTICKNCRDGDHWQWGRCYTAKAADARLIAAAPELLAALEQVKKFLTPALPYPERDRLYALVCAVISKAEDR